MNEFSKRFIEAGRKQEFKPCLRSNDTCPVECCRTPNPPCETCICARLLSEAMRRAEKATAK